MKKPPSSKIDTVSTRNKKNRRQLLKTLAVGGGAVAATSEIPSDWVKPVVDSTLLPSHASTSCSLITQFSINVDAGGDDQGTFNNSGSTDTIPTNTNDIEYNFTANVSPAFGQSFNLSAINTQSNDTSLTGADQNVVPSNNGVLSFNTIAVTSHGDNGDTGVQFTLSNDICESTRTITIDVPLPIIN